MLLAVFISTHVVLSLPAHLQLDGTFFNKLFGLRYIRRLTKNVESDTHVHTLMLLLLVTCIILMVVSYSVTLQEAVQ